MGSTRVLRDPQQTLHDALEEGYLAQMAAGGGRWFCERRDGYALAGFAGLDAPTTSRITRLDVEASGFPTVLADAGAYFAGRHLPWCVALTPFARPPDVRVELRRRRFQLLAEFSVMTLTTPPPARPPAPAVRVRAIDGSHAALFTQLTIDGFGMPERYYPALRDIGEGWLRQGARAYVADLHGEPVGAALAIRTGNVTGIYNVSVVRRARRLGVARAMLDRLLADVVGDGLVTLQVSRGGSTEAMYERLGFARQYAWELWSTFS